jgi:16S rRNA (cytosine967-C5)-methyltransferase
MRAERLTSAVAFVSAVARRLPEQSRAAPDAGEHPVAHLAVEYSHPQWLVERWLRHWGFAECAALCESNNRIAPLTLRVNTLRTQPQEIIDRLRARGLDAAPGNLSPVAVVVQNAGDPSQWPEWNEALIIAQDEAAQLVSLLAAPQPGQTVIDAAAAPGGKTTHLAQLMNDSGALVACDVAPGRLKLVRENAERLGIKSIQLQEGDIRHLATELPAADIVLLDAPCLGTGTLRRRPDAKWRKTAQQLNELTQLQKELLDAAATVVRPGGALVYSTCSLEVEENEEQARAWLQRHPDWHVEPPGDYPTGTNEALEVVTTDGFLQTLPHRHGCDGMFAVKWRRATG